MAQTGVETCDCVVVIPDLLEDGGSYAGVSIKYCSLHKFAFELFQACKYALQVIDKNAMTYSEITHGKRVYPYDLLRTLISKVEGKVSQEGGN